MQVEASQHALGSIALFCDPEQGNSVPSLASGTLRNRGANGTEAPTIIFASVLFCMQCRGEETQSPCSGSMQKQSIEVKSSVLLDIPELPLALWTKYHPVLYGLLYCAGV